ncbi:MAG: hypothetical protein AVDCRST_MAG85-3464 [uncultured Solirubrobacteraceae bacterium]|uniref:EAL domain-containing protein n=1 Tax=uncultured Solirubrobacteraceae bacterium TaxID=1162706 RepID=A0A6J4TR34_9ACTN|nr:MAG: hypothetical protein AVDCRST_MAG85-3464 [uncultured Solirubrobacteraceae bacterium]
MLHALREAAARAFAERLRSLGCKLALDDFGTGYGGFTYLENMPVDHLKIDIEFVRDLVTNLAPAPLEQVLPGPAPAPSAVRPPR